MNNLLKETLMDLIKSQTVFKDSKNEIYLTKKQYNQFRHLIQNKKELADTTSTAEYICGMKVIVKDSTNTEDFEGATYIFRKLDEANDLFKPRNRKERRHGRR